MIYNKLNLELKEMLKSEWAKYKEVLISAGYQLIEIEVLKPHIFSLKGKSSIYAGFGFEPFEKMEFTNFKNVQKLIEKKCKERAEQLIESARI